MSQASVDPRTPESNRLQPAQGRLGHERAHPHPHDHTHDHAHPHGHAHDPALIHAPGFSLLRLSATMRLAGAAAISGLLWASVWWALS